MEFATKWVMVTESVRRAATAEDKHQTQQAVEEATNALALLREAIEAYAAVARNQTDRGAIALAVEYGHRPLEKKLSELNNKQASAAVSRPLIQRLDSAVKEEDWITLKKLSDDAGRGIDRPRNSGPGVGR